MKIIEIIEQFRNIKQVQYFKTVRTPVLILTLFKLSKRGLLFQILLPILKK